MKQALLAVILSLVLLTATSQENRKSDSILTSLEDLQGKKDIIEKIVEIGKSHQITFDAATSIESAQNMKHSLRSLQQGKPGEQLQNSSQVAQSNKTQINDMAPHNSKQTEQKNTQPLHPQPKNQIQKKNSPTEIPTDEDEIEYVEVNQPENSTETLNKNKEETKVANGEQKATTQPTIKSTSVQSNQTSDPPKVQAASNSTVNENDEEVEDLQGKKVTQEEDIDLKEEEKDEQSQIKTEKINKTENDDEQEEVEKTTNKDPVDLKANNTKDQNSSQFDEPSEAQTIEQNSPSQKNNKSTNQPVEQTAQEDQAEVNQTEKALTNQEKEVKQAQKAENKPVEVNITDNKIAEKITKKPTDQIKAQEKNATIQTLGEKDVKSNTSILAPVLPAQEKNDTAAAEKGEKSTNLTNITQKGDTVEKKEEKEDSNLTKMEDVQTGEKQISNLTKIKNAQTEANKTEVKPAEPSKKQSTQSTNSTAAKEISETSSQDKQNNTVPISAPPAETNKATIEESKNATIIEKNITEIKKQNAKNNNYGKNFADQQQNEKSENNTQNAPSTQNVPQSEKNKTKLEVNKTSQPASPTKTEKEAQSITTSNPTPTTIETNKTIQSVHAKEVNQSTQDNQDELKKEQPIQNPLVAPVPEKNVTQEEPKDKVLPTAQTVNNTQKVEQKQSSTPSSTKESIPANNEDKEKTETIKPISESNPLYQPPKVTDQDQKKQVPSLTTSNPKDNKVSQKEIKQKVEQVHQRDFITEQFGDNGYLFVGGILLGSLLVMCIIVKICKSRDERSGFKNMSSEQQYTGSPI